MSRRLSPQEKELRNALAWADKEGIAVRFRTETGWERTKAHRDGRWTAHVAWTDSA